MRISKHALCVTVAAAFASGVQAGSLTVITSFPKEITEAYKKSFEKKYPGTKVEMLNKNTNASLAFIRETPIGQRPDVFWASAPDAFEVLAGEKILEKAPEVRNPEIPSMVGTYPMNDPEGFYYGQALSGYGIMWNTRYMAAHKLPNPAQWDDLKKAVYFGHVAISSPSRSGTTHLTVEAILQGEGWEKGWSTLLQIGGNCAAITNRSFGVPDGVNSGQFGIGIVIDFFGLAGKYSGFPVEFVYPKVTAIVPASIGLIAGAKNSVDGKKFIAYTLSPEGQELLLDPKISRMPALPYVNSNKVPSGYPNIFEIARKANSKFDSTLSESRYNVVSSLYDQTITFRLKELQAAAKAIHDAEKKLGVKPNAPGAALLKQARDLAYTPLVGQKMASNNEFLSLFTKTKKAVSANTDKELSALEEHWSSKAKANYAKAAELAQQAGALAK